METLLLFGCMTISLQANTLLLQVTVSNLPNLESQLFQLYTEIHGIVHAFMPEEDDEMPPLENIMDDEA